MDVIGPQFYPDYYTRRNVFSKLQVTPAAGSDISISVPNGVLWHVDGLRAVLTASATAANRMVGFSVKDQDGNSVWEYQMTAAVTANLTGTFCFSPWTSTVPTAFATTNSLLLPAPDTFIPPGWSFGSSTLNIGTADAWTAVRLWVEEWLPPAGE